MRFLFIAAMLLGVSTVSGCSASPGADSYTLVSPVSPDKNGLAAYLIDYDSGEKLDSAVVADGKAQFSGRLDGSCLARLIVDGARAGVVILEPGDISVDTASRVGRGTPLNDAFYTYVNRADSIETAYEALPADSAGMAARQSLMRRYEDLNRTTLAANADNPVGYYLFLQQGYEMTLPELDKAIAGMPQFAGYKRVAALRDNLLKASSTGVGSRYTDFAITYDGKTSRLSDYVGKDGQYTLVDFWASWCGPCIKETRTIKELYERFGNGRGLNVVGVAVWDEPENTLRAIEAHRLPWPQIINADKIPTDIYGISGIPCIILIDPDGTIVSRGKQGAELVADVEAALAPASAD